MSDPQRYSLALPDISYGMDEDSKGAYVLWKDYTRLKSENERLRKAGDALITALDKRDDVFDNSDKRNAINAWLAAKEGKQSV